ncbi:class I SAM-dependent methyltransferase [Lysinibacillus yapensis]|uniref:class I SAM-dependent methyltransferase n=1 Tax=Ureibacillus yapensis TaxID=2304605 RepID=UPI001F2784D3|nr:methyltransferase domain-containing protein [Lysinibacillus yapensis]
MRGPLAINFESLWQEGMHDWQGNMPERMKDDTLEEAFWRQSIAKKIIRQIDDHAKPIFEIIQQYIHPTDEVLEIGPGWGNYTFPLQAYARKVTCVDSSEAVLDYLKMCFQEAQNVHYVYGKWEQADVEAHDIVVGVNCFYRMYYMLSTLKKMNALAKKRVIIGMTTGPIQPHYKVLDEEFGYEIKYPRRDYIQIVNMLYQLGIFADCQMLQLERTYHYATKEELIAAQSKKILSGHYDPKHVEQALEPFITVDAEGYHYKHTFNAAVISWKPVKEVLNDDVEFARNAKTFAHL